MALLEKRAMRNGVELPIQCIHMHKHKAECAQQQHYHEYTELLYGLSGRARVVIGTQEHLLTRGDMIIVHDHTPHDALGIGEPADYIVVKFLPRILLADEQTYHEYAYTLLLTESPHGKQIFFRAEELADTDMEELFAHLMKEWNEQTFGHELGLRADVTLIYLHILRAWHKYDTAPSDARNGDLYRMMQTAISHIAQNYADLCEEDVAAACGVSRSYFSRTFRRTMHIGFSEYVSAVRLREAECMLLTTDASITEIAEATGFSTVSYFIAKFRAARGVSPARYRAQIRATT